MRRATLLFVVACSSSSSPATVESQMQFSVTTGTYGNGPLPCDGQQSGIWLDPGTLQLHVFCNQATGPSASTTIANITLAGFHGADTYTFAGSNDFSESALSFDLDNYSWTAVPASAGISATACSVTIDAPAAPQRGDAVSGSFHCDAILGFVIEGDGGYHPQPAISVDGRRHVMADSRRSRPTRAPSQMPERNPNGARPRVAHRQTSPGGKHRKVVAPNAPLLATTRTT